MQITPPTLSHHPVPSVANGTSVISFRCRLRHPDLGTAYSIAPMRPRRPCHDLADLDGAAQTEPGRRQALDDALPPRRSRPGRAALNPVPRPHRPTSPPGPDLHAGHKGRRPNMLWRVACQHDPATILPRARAAAARVCVAPTRGHGRR